MPDDLNFEPPSFDDYARWYEKQFDEILYGGRPEQWYQNVTAVGLRAFEQSTFWQKLQVQLPVWDGEFKADHDAFRLLEPEQPREIKCKSFNAAVNKAFRWNVLENAIWPDPPEKAPSSASGVEELDPDDVRLWFGPNNWLTDFPDIFRTRLVTTYFDGVRYLAGKVRELAELTTTPPPNLRFMASLDGYHAAHLWVNDRVETFDYDTGDIIPVQIRLEVQVTTAIQSSISDMLHRVYEEWRVAGRPPNWEWDHESPAFSVNYLGSTLHYLEGMIVIARDKGRSR